MVESSISIIDKINLQYISGCKPHFISQFLENELDLKLIS